MDPFTQLFGSLLVFVYHCFDSYRHIRLPEWTVAARAGGELLEELAIKLG
jgi:hypothetical protein